MPLFDCCCNDCGFGFEKVQKFSATENPICPRCGGKTERMVSKSSFVLAGEGWAKDNYKGEKR